jgi:hypothetical protein
MQTSLSQNSVAFWTLLSQTHVPSGIVDYTESKLSGVIDNAEFEKTLMS